MTELPTLEKHARPEDPAHHDFCPWPGYEKRGFKDLLRWNLGDNPHAEKKKSASPTPNVEQDPLAKLAAAREAGADLLVMWLGHATFLIEIDGVRVITDPLFGRASPFVPRQAPAPLTAQQIEGVDIVLLTHGHRDHFDASSLASLANHNPDALFVTPVGLNKALPGSCKRKLEVDWWDHFTVKGVRFTHTPSQHWHQRTPFDRNKALWGGWHLHGAHTLYHMGDSGYFEGFKTVAHVLETPDVMMLPMGAYEPRWFMGPQHMDPAGALQSWKDVGATWGIPMHWGTFDLSNEPLDAGPKEFRELLAEDPAGEQLAKHFHELPHGGVASWKNKELLSR
jgi:L-ascorbate metabolism protein UlaG (beta-lactamase superfamily)